MKGCVCLQVLPRSPPFPFCHPSHTATRKKHGSHTDRIRTEASCMQNPHAFITLLPRVLIEYTRAIPENLSGRKPMMSPHLLFPDAHLYSLDYGNDARGPEAADGGEDSNGKVIVWWATWFQDGNARGHLCWRHTRWWRRVALGVWLGERHRKLESQ